MVSLSALVGWVKDNIAVVDPIVLAVIDDGAFKILAVVVLKVTVPESAEFPPALIAMTLNVYDVLDVKYERFIVVAG